MSVKSAATESRVLREVNEMVLVANVTEGWGDLFANFPKGWKCESCGVTTNPFSADQCVACETKRPGLGNGWGDLFANVPKGWKCASCGVTTNPFSADQCVACETKRPGLENKADGGGGAATGGGVNGEGASS
jgi:rubredoxin